MDPLLGVFGALLIIAVLLSLARARRHTGARRTASRSLRDYGTEAEIEEHDIDDMLDAINERRRRTGRRDVGEELADEAMRGTWSDR
jgi:hypothetical protein